MNLKSDKAITLVALIITIIILLILAGVTLSMILGDNGLINKAQSSVDKYQKSANKEQNMLYSIEAYIEDKPHAADGTWDDIKQVNTPKLADGMIPIKWNGENWVITTGTDPDWYNYKTVGRNGTEIGINDGSYYTGENNYVSNVEQSTIGNVYGIYDMSGGAWEYTVAGLTANVTSIFGSITGFAEKYVNRYNGSSSDRTENYNANSGKYGDAVYETSNSASPETGSWNSRCANFVSSSDPFFARGGDYLISRAAGTCAFSCSGPYYSIGFRPTLVV